VDPGAVVPPAFAMVRLETTGGRRVEGVRLREDSFSIQILDSSGQVHSFWFGELASLERHRTTPMPRYEAAFTPAELSDLVSYLLSLKGAT
jgi:hypothetical protein